MLDPLSLAAAAELASLSSVARTLEPVMPHERRGVLREEAALLLDGLLVRVARGRGALDLALGDGLATLTVGDRFLRLGFSGLADYARERLGVAGSTAEKLVRLTQHLAERPLLRQAVHAGAVSPRKAETIVALARGDQEAAWVARARVETVRSLAAGVKEALGGGVEDEEERWERVAFAGRPGMTGDPCGPGQPGGRGQLSAHAKLDEALALAGKLLGAAAPKWQRLEAMCEEYLGAHPPPVSHDEAGDRPCQMFDQAPTGRDLDELEAWLEKESDRWAFISSFDPAPRPEAGGQQAGGGAAGGGAMVGAAAGGPSEAESGANLSAAGEPVAGEPGRNLAAAVDPREGPAAAGGPSEAESGASLSAAGQLVAGEPGGNSAAAIDPIVDLARLDAGLRRLRDLRSRWDDVFGHLAMLLRQLGLWRDMQFASFAHYCSERLGMSERAVSQRASLERRLYELPALRAAMLDGRVTYEKARIVAAHADERTLDGWIDRAGRLPCIALAREAEAEEEAQTCARGDFSFRLPARVVSLLDLALQAAKEAAGRFITAAEALERVAEHFIATWKPLLAEKNTLRTRVLARDRGWCQVPGCSRAALQVHHVRYRSHGGAFVSANLVSLCAAHHLHGVHAGYLRVVGEAPHRLCWSFPVGGGPAVVPAVAPAVRPGMVAAVQRAVRPGMVAAVARAEA